jgi:predicted O-methyltransferase YrrM
MTPAARRTLLHLESLKSTDQFWNIDWDSGQFLHQLVLAKQPKNILEIGTSTGFSAVWMASALYPGATLTTIDASKKRHPISQQAFEMSELDCITGIFGHAPEVFDRLSGQQFDMIFIDCAKNYYLQFFQYLQPQMNPGCIVLADNMISHGQYMAQYFEYVRNHEQFVSTLVSIGSGMEMTTKLK